MNNLLLFNTPSMLLRRKTSNKSVVVSQEGFTVDSIDDITSGIRNNPIYQIFLVETIFLGIVAVFDQFFFDHFPTLLILMVYAPTIPAWFIERSWNRLQKENENYTLLKQKADTLRLDFLLIGLVYSGIFLILSQIHLLIIGSTYYSQITSYSTENFPRYQIFIGDFRFNPTLIMAIIYYLVFAIGLGLVAYKFMTTVTKQESTSEHNRFYDHPLVLLSNLSYFLIGTMTIPLVFYPFQPIRVSDFNIYVDVFLSDLFYHFIYVLYGISLPIIFLFPLFILAIIAVHVQFLPYTLEGDKFTLNAQNKLIRWVIYVVGITIIFAIITIQMFPNQQLVQDENLRFRFYIMVIIAYILTLYLIYQSVHSKPVCQRCGFYGGEECIYCKERDENGNNFTLGTKTKVPKCPNCGQNWDNLSRRCQNCQYTIVLTCDNCSQTINPLWRKCNLCGEPRRTVPEIALNKQTDNRFAYSRARYIVLLLLTIPFVIVEVIYLQLLYPSLQVLTEADAITPYVAGAIFYDNIRRLVAWGIFTVFILLLIYRSSTGDGNSRIILTDELIRITYTEFFVIGALMFFVVGFSLVLNGFGLGPLILSFIGLAVIAGIMYKRYRYLKDYNPVIISRVTKEVN